MRKQAEAIMLEEQEKVREKQMKASRLLIDVETSNKMSMAMKDKKKLEEREMDDQIDRYNQQKSQQEYDRQMREKALKDEKERELQKMRDAQEKTSDRQEQIDAARAKRAFEDGERKARLIEQLDREKKDRLLKDLDIARQRQFADKESTLASTAANERDEFLNIIQT